MKIYRWYEEQMCMSGFTVAGPADTKEDVVSEIESYIDNTFPDAAKYDELFISVWSIEEDDDYNAWCPTTIATGY